MPHNYFYREALATQSYFHLSASRQGRTYFDIPIGVCVEACFTRSFPMRRQGFVLRVFPIMKDLMEYLGHHRRPRVWRRGVMFEGYLELRYSSASMCSEKSE